MQTICEFSFRCQPKLGRCNTQNTTGVSAADRVTTIHASIAENAVPSDLVSPGHIFSLRARSGGVLERRGHIDGSVYLTRLAGLKLAAVMCEPMNSDRTMMRGVQSDAFASTHSFFPTLMIDGLVSCRHELALQKGHAVKALAKDWSADAGREVSCAA